MDLVKCLLGNKITSLMKFHFMVRKTQEALKRSHHCTQVPEWHQASVSQLLRPNLVPTSSVARPHSSSNRVTFDSPPLLTFFLFPLQPAWNLPRGPNRVAWGSYIQSLIWYIHHFHRVGGDYIMITSWEGPCVSYLWADVICLWESASIAHDICVEQF